jgi:hypothetical protein
MSLEIKKKAGRPKLAKERARHIYLAIRLLPEENALINSAVAASSEKKSNWIRKSLINAAKGDKRFT